VKIDSEDVERSFLSDEKWVKSKKSWERSLGSAVGKGKDLWGKLWDRMTRNWGQGCQGGGLEAGMARG
jgi:hypothetical protein